MILPCDVEKKRTFRNRTVAEAWLIELIKRQSEDYQKVLERFFSHVIKSDDGCWLWTPLPKNANYAHFSVFGKDILAHRTSFLIHGGTIPGDALILHNCDVKPCVRPDHLFLGDHGVNARDMGAKGRQHWQKNKYWISGDMNWQRRLPHLKKVGSKHYKAKLTEAEVVTIRERVAGGENQHAIAREFSLDSTTINGIVLGDAWKHAGGPIKERKNTHV